MRRPARASRASTTVRYAARSVPCPPSPRLCFTPRPLPVHRRGPPRHCESRFYRGVDGQQLAVLPRPAPRLLAVERDVPGARTRAGPLRTQLPRIRHPCPSVALAQQLTPPPSAFSQGPDALPGVRTQPACNLRNLRNSHSSLTLRFSLDRMPAGVGASRCRASRRARRWWASRRRRTRRWCSTAAARRSRAAAAGERSAGGAAARPRGEAPV